MCRKADNPWLLSDIDFVFTSLTEMYLHVLLISKYKYEFLVWFLFNLYLTQKIRLLRLKIYFTRVFWPRKTAV